MRLRNVLVRKVGTEDHDRNEHEDRAVKGKKKVRRGRASVTAPVEHLFRSAFIPNQAAR